MTAVGKGKRLGLVLRHDDAKREYAYDRKSKIGHLDKAFDESGNRSPPKHSKRGPKMKCVPGRWCLMIAPLMHSMKRLRFYLVLLVLTSFATVPAYGEEPSQTKPATPSQSEVRRNLAKQSQNPVAPLIQVPLKNDTNFNFGPEEGTQNILTIEPVVPVRLSEDVNLIGRGLIPIISNPGLAPGDDRTTGLGDIGIEGFFTPAKPGKVLFGFGPLFQLPTHTDSELGNNNWAAGPTAVVLTQPGHWVIGTLVSQIWSFAGSDDDISSFNLQYFINYNLPDGWFLTTTPTIKANWHASSGNTWTVPVGGGAGKVFHIGKLPMKLEFQGFYNVIKPDFGSDWTFEVELTLLFPE